MTIGWKPPPQNIYHIFHEKENSKNKFENNGKPRIRIDFLHSYMKWWIKYKYVFSKIKWQKESNTLQYIITTRQLNQKQLLADDHVNTMEKYHFSRCLQQRLHFMCRYDFFRLTING